MLATKEIGYRDGETELTGFLAADDTRPDPRPGLLLLHGGAGLDSHAREQTLRYAALGYVVFACDMYGSSVAGDREQVIGAIEGLLREPEAMLARGLAGLRVLEDCPQFNGQAAAVGFCFGGRSALEFARSGMDLAGVVSIHGSLVSNQHCVPGSIKSKVLVCHGGRDPHVPLHQVAGFIHKMNTAGADCQVVIYASALHGFTHKHPPVGLSEGTAYDRSADRRSFAAAGVFLAEVFEGGH